MSLLGLVVSVVGLPIAIWQLVRTARAAEATERAFVTSNRTQFLFLLPQFRQLELELDLSLEHDNRLTAGRALSSYAYLANEVAALVEELGIGSADVIAEIRNAGTAAADAKNNIIKRRDRKLTTLVSDFQAQMLVVTGHLSSLRQVGLAYDRQPR